MADLLTTKPRQRLGEIDEAFWRAKQMCYRCAPGQRRRTLRRRSAA